MVLKLIWEKNVNGATLAIKIKIWLRNYSIPI